MGTINERTPMAKATKNSARTTPPASSSSDLLDGYWAVYLLTATNPDQPLAVFQYPDHARKWAEDPQNYQGRKIGYMRWPDKPSNDGTDRPRAGKD